MYVGHGFVYILSFPSSSLGTGLCFSFPIKRKPEFVGSGSQAGAWEPAKSRYFGMDAEIQAMDGSQSVAQMLDKVV